LPEANAQLEVAAARLELADRQLDRAKDLEAKQRWISPKTLTSGAYPISGRRAQAVEEAKSPNPRCTVRPRPLPDYGRRFHQGAWARNLVFP